jgi:hypothetical protein
MKRERMAVGSRPAKDDTCWGWVLVILALLFLGGVALYVAVAVYRQQHCIYLLGHWLSLERTTFPLVCQ